MDRFFSDFGLGRNRLAGAQGAMWSPQVEVFQRGNELIVRAELPGLSKDDVKVEINDNVPKLVGEVVAKVVPKI